MFVTWRRQESLELNALKYIIGFHVIWSFESLSLSLLFAIIITIAISGLPALSLTKRAPVGFFGMRGKKDELMEATLPLSEQQQLDQSEGPAQGGDDGEESDGYEEELQQKSDLQVRRKLEIPSLSYTYLFDHPCSLGKQTL